MSWSNISQTFIHWLWLTFECVCHFNRIYVIVCPLKVLNSSTSLSKEELYEYRKELQNHLYNTFSHFHENLSYQFWSFFHIQCKSVPVSNDFIPKIEFTNPFRVVCKYNVYWFTWNIASIIDHEHLNWTSEVLLIS
jgi:hypothetical protein